MGEIKTPVARLKEGEIYIPGYEDYVITEDNTIADIARICIELGWAEDLVYCITEEINA